MADEQKKRRRFYTWSTFFILALLLGILFALLWLYHEKAVTDSRPAALPATTLPEAQLRQLQQRVETFRAAVRSRQLSPAPLMLTSDEVNALIATDADCEPLKDHFHVALEGSVAKAQFSFPTAQLSLAPKGRFLNGSGIFSVALRNGILQIKATSITIKHHSLPAELAAHFENENFAEAINANPRAQAAFKRIESIEIKNGKLIITPKKE